MVLVRDRTNDPKVLVGQRGSSAVFMPDKYVFPGGALDPDDNSMRLLVDHLQLAWSAFRFVQAKSLLIRCSFALFAKSGRRPDYDWPNVPIILHRKQRFLESGWSSAVQDCARAQRVSFSSAGPLRPKAELGELMRGFSSATSTQWRSPVTRTTSARIR